jgi:hypothetical protein
LTGNGGQHLGQSDNAESDHLECDADHQSSLLQNSDSFRARAYRSGAAQVATVDRLRCDTRH